MSEKLLSENVVVSAPFSLNGSALRIWKLTNTSENALMKWLILVPIALFLIGSAWIFVVGWYIVFGILLIPYRLIRRSSRKNKRDKLRHREVFEAIRDGKAK